MNHCYLCTRGLGQLQTGQLPLCLECSQQLHELPPAERMRVSTAMMQALETRRMNDGIHRLAIRLDDALNLAETRSRR